MSGPEGGYMEFVEVRADKPNPKMNRKVTDNFVFIRPMEAPVFTPTAEEFKDPLGYLNKIRPAAEKAGICKIRPPPSWLPPFTVDVDNFKFTPRVQRLNELEAKTRIKLNFLDQIAKFWELQGSSLKIPIIDKKALCLYTLHELVQEEGGIGRLNNDKKWNRLAIRLGYSKEKNYGPMIRGHYEKILYPYDHFQFLKKQANEGSVNSPKKLSPKNSPIKGGGMKSKSVKSSPLMPYSSSKSAPLKSGGRMGGKPKAIPEYDDDNGQKLLKSNKELRRLLFYGAGPKMAGYNNEDLETHHRIRKSEISQDPLAKYMCQVCSRGDSEESMLLCDGCDDSYHTFCLDPPLKEVPKGEWRCPQCVAEEVSKPSEAFGFEQAQREYTLQQFGEMADRFKSEYFNMPVHLVPSELVEKEFWRIVSAIDEDVTVEYGADLHTMDHGSGFPTTIQEDMGEQEGYYVNCGWNLNNLPVLPGSVLGHINADISGMKVPWMYVGMCFATFCWHNEDHWSYSINYLHWGEPKTWYGVPGSRADDFENAMKQAAPELFHSQPDLLHQLVTIMNPNILMKAGVPVYRMDQRAGEFIITFPRAYHAGFNQGYNFAEAVNFAPADWLSIGRDCIAHYSNLHRYCVFSHDELICKMASEPRDLDLIITIATSKDIQKMFEIEKEYRKVILSWGLTMSERAAFELMPDDERLCDFCKTTCFLSAIVCRCTPDRLVCLKHYDRLCECPPDKHILRYRYTLDEIPTLIAKLNERSLQYENWIRSVEGTLNDKIDNKEKIYLEDLKDLVGISDKNGFPKTTLYDMAIHVCEEAEKCSVVALKLTSSVMRTRNRGGEDKKYPIQLEELQLFSEQLESLPVRVKELAHIKSLLNSVTSFQATTKALLANPDSDVAKLKACLKEGSEIPLWMGETKALKTEIEKRNWLKEVRSSEAKTWTYDVLISEIKKGRLLDKDPEIEDQLKQMMITQDLAEKWEAKASVLTVRGKISISMFSKFLKQGERIPIQLEQMAALKEERAKANQWIVEVGNMKLNPATIEEMSHLIEIALEMPVAFPEFESLEEHVNTARKWVTLASKMFCKYFSTATLSESLLPRTIESFEQGIENTKVIPKADVLLEIPSFDELSVRWNIPVALLKKRSEFEDAYLSHMGIAEIKLAELRERNSVKTLTSTDICICKQLGHASKLRCDVCFDLFHITCVPLPRAIPDLLRGIHYSQATMIHHFASKKLIYLCPYCARTKRPPLLPVIDLMKSVQTPPAAMVEVEALQAITKKSFNWQQKFRDLCMEPEIANAIKLLDIEDYELVKSDREAKAAKKTAAVEEKKIQPNGLPGKINNLKYLPEHVAKQCQEQREQRERSPSTVSAATALMSLYQDQSATNNNSQEKKDVDNFYDLHPSFHMTEHAYSTASKVNFNASTKKISPLRPGRFSFNFDPELKKSIENLFIEGAMIEVDMPEVVILWKLLAKQHELYTEENLPTIQEIQHQLETEIIPRERANKRRHSGTKRQSGEETATKKGKPKTKNDEPVAESSTSSQKKGRKKKTYEEDCAAVKCLQPSGEVNWVQCDLGCEGWYHLDCVGLKNEEVEAMPNYECRKCSSNRLGIKEEEF